MGGQGETPIVLLQTAASKFLSDACARRVRNTLLSLKSCFRSISVIIRFRYKYWYDTLPILLCLIADYALGWVGGSSSSSSSSADQSPENATGDEDQGGIGSAPQLMVNRSLKYLVADSSSLAQQWTL